MVGMIAVAIASADIGIAMDGMGSDAAIETADVVIMANTPTKVAEPIQIAHTTRSIVWQNIGVNIGNQRSISTPEDDEYGFAMGSRIGRCQRYLVSNSQCRSSLEIEIDVFRHLIQFNLEGIEKSGKKLINTQCLVTYLPTNKSVFLAGFRSAHMQAQSAFWENYQRSSEHKFLLARAVNIVHSFRIFLLSV